MNDSIGGTIPNEEVEIDLREVLGLLLVRWPVIVLCTLVSVLAAAFFSYMASPVYESQTEVLVESQARMGNEMFLLGTRDTDKMANRLQIIQSPLVIDRAKGILGVVDDSEEGRSFEKRVSTSVVGDTDVIRIKFTAGTPLEARQGAEALARAYMEYSRERAQEQSRRMVAFLQEQVDRTEQEVMAAEGAVRDFQQEVGIISLDDEAGKINHQLTELENRLVMADINLQERRLTLERREEELVELRNRLPQGATLVTDRLVEQLKTNLAELEAERIDFLNRGLDRDSPEVSSLSRRIENLEESIREYSERMVSEAEGAGPVLERYQNLLVETTGLEAEIAGLTSEKQILRDKISTYEQELWSLSDKNFEMAKLKREVSVASNTYDMLSQELERARIAVERELGEVELLRPAELPESPVSPRIPLNIAISLFLGLFVGTGIVFGLEFLDNSIRDHDQLEGLGLGLLGHIPLVEVDADDSYPSLLLDEEDDTDPISLAFIKVESSLRFASFDSPLNVLLFTSALPDEGKSTTTLNMAYTLAHSGENVLLIDLDLRKPKLHKTFGESREPGLTELVAGQLDVEYGLRGIELSSEEFKLDLITAGSRPPRIINLLRSQKFADLITRFKEDYDWVLIDTPPVQVATDAREVTGLVDGIVMVTAQGQTPYPAFENAVEQLRQAGGNILGTVFNMTESKKSRYYGYGYNYSYQYASEYMNED